MTRKKVKLAFIANDSARKATYKKRKKGLIKKVDELTTLCGIEACAIVYSPYDAQPEIWPSAFGVQRVLSKFRRMPELEQSKKMVNQEGFLKQRIFKAKEQLKKQRKDNREKEMTQIMYQYLSAGKILHNMTMMDLNDLAWLIEQNLKDIGRRVEVLDKRVDEPTQGQGQSQSHNENQEEVSQPASVVAPPPAPVVAPPLAPTVVTATDAAIVVVEARNERDKAKVEEVESVGVAVDAGMMMSMSLPMSMSMFMPKQPWFMDSMTGGEENETMPFADVSHPNAFWHNIQYYH